MKILVTGASGFVGKKLVAYLAGQGHEHEVLAAMRESKPVPDGAKAMLVPDICTADWVPLLQGVDAVIHLAARVHRMHDSSADPLAKFRKVNRDATVALAQAAQAAGVKRFIFLSSVKAAVDATGLDSVDEQTPPAPASPYGISKLEAETALLAISGLEIVILRPPLVYGPGVKANFRLLVRLARLPILPLGAIDNRRSLLSLGNLLCAIEISLTAAVAGKAWYLDDGAPVSTPALLRALSKAIGRHITLLPVPVWLLRGLATLAGQQDKIDRLTESLAVNSAAFRKATGWQPEPLAQALSNWLAPPYSNQLFDPGERHMERATFGAGCFWGVEEAFRRLPGVSETAVGYLGGQLENPSYKDVCTDTTGHAEVVQLTFDPAQIGYDKLLEAFWQIHDPTQLNRQGPDYGSQYRTAIFTHSDEQAAAARESKDRLDKSGKFRRPIATEITPAGTFWKAEDYHQQYLAKRGQASCHI